MPLPALFWLAVHLGNPAAIHQHPGPAWFGEYYGFVVITYEDAEGVALARYVSGPVFYCEGRTSAVDALEVEAQREEAFKGSSGYWTRPSRTAKRVVEFNGGNTTRQEAERNIAAWVRMGAKPYRSDMEGSRYWDPNVCKALGRF